MADNSERYLISFNGEIFNFKELRNDLTNIGCHFKTQSDTEVLLEGYLKTEKIFLTKLEVFLLFVSMIKKRM